MELEEENIDLESNESTHLSTQSQSQNPTSAHHHAHQTDGINNNNNNSHHHNHHHHHDHHHHDHHHHDHHHHHTRVQKLKRGSAMFKSFKVRQEFKKDIHGNTINTSDSTHRAASYLELFYDLIMAASFAKLGDSLGESLADLQSSKALLTSLSFYFVCFYSIYGTWLTVTSFLNRFQSDGAYDHVLILANIIFVGCCNLFIEAAISPPHDMRGFAVFLIFAQFTVMVSYLLVFYQHKDWKRLNDIESEKAKKVYYFSRNYAVDRLISILFLIPIFFLHPEKYWYIVAILLFLSAFQYTMFILVAAFGYIKYFTKHAYLVPVNPKLVQERQGLIFIIGLGEIVITSTLSNIEAEESILQTLFSVGNVALGASMAMMFCLMYFKLYDWPGEESCTVVIRKSGKHALVWLNGNFILCMCATLTGCVLKRSTSGSYTDSDRILLVTSISVFIAMITFSDMLHVVPKIVEYGKMADIGAIIFLNLWAYACAPSLNPSNQEGQEGEESKANLPDDDETTEETSSINAGAAPTLCVYLVILLILAGIRKKLLPIYLTKAGKEEKDKGDVHGHGHENGDGRGQDFAKIIPFMPH